MWRVSWSVLLALVMTVTGGLLVHWWYASHPSEWSDFDQIWLGAHALVRGHNPYIEVPKAFPWPLLYPLPALLLGLPFVMVPLELARVGFAMVTAGLCTWAVLRRRAHAWPLLLTGPFAYALIRGQWSPLFVAAMLVPALSGIVVTMKPSTGLAVLAYRPSRALVIGAAGVGLLSLLVMPSWPLYWLRELPGNRHIVPLVTLPAGVLLLLAFLRWRRPEGRMLGALAIIPQTPAMYELVPTLLIPQTLRASLVLALLWNVVYLWAPSPVPWTPATVPDPFIPGRWTIMLVCGYLPALLLLFAQGRRPPTTQALNAREDPE